MSVSGRVLNQQGSGIRNARVNLRDSRGNNFTATTNAFGYFSLESILSGETYVAAVQVRGMMFTPRLVTINDSIDALEFRPLQ